MKNLVIFLFISLSACAQKNNHAIPLSADSMKMIIEKKQGIILDVRTPEEFAEGHIPGAINIDYNDDHFENGLDSLKKEETYYVYCRSGKRSAAAVDIMDKKGFKKIYHYHGGILEWKEKGNALV